MAEVEVGADGAYEVWGLEGGFYSLCFESWDGHFLAVDLLRMHDEDDLSSMDDQGLRTLRPSLEQLREKSPELSGLAEPTDRTSKGAAA